MNEPGDTPGPEQAPGTAAVPDAHAELLRQIRRALIMDAGLRIEEGPAGGGFDPYNHRTSSTGGQWRVRRRD